MRVAGDNSGVLLGPGEERDVAVRIVPPRKGTAPKLGSAYAIDVQADYDHDLYNLSRPRTRARTGSASRSAACGSSSGS